MISFSNDRLLRALTFCKVLPIALTSAAFNMGTANASEVDEQAWGQFTLQRPLDDAKDWVARFDSHTRLSNDTQKLDIGILQGAISHKLSPRLTATMGIDRMTFYRDSGDIVEERIWEQAAYPISTLLGGSLSGRTRVEQRQRKGSHIGHRARQLLRWNKPIAESDWSFVVMNELFMNINDTQWGQDNGVDQNHTLLGVNYRYSSNFKVETGYVHMRLNRNDDQIVHAFHTQVLFYL